MEKEKESCLVLTALERYWPTDKHIVFLGDWCQKYSRKAYWEKLDYEVVPNVWENPDSIREFDEYCVDLTDRLIVALTKALNELHGETHSVSYWRIILVFWLYFYINDWAGHYRELVNALERYPDIEIPILDCHDIQYPLSKTKVYTKTGEKGDDLDLYYFYLYSRIINSLSQERAVRVKYCNAAADNYIAPESSRTRKLQIGIRPAILQKSYHIFYKNSPILCYNFYVGGEDRKLRKKTLGKVCFLRIERASVKKNEQDLYDLGLRKKMNINFQCQNEVEKIILKNIIYDLPIIFIERYKQLVKFRKKKYNFKPEIVLLPGGNDSEMAVYVAEWMGRGVDIYCTPHCPLDSIFKKNFFEFVFLANCKKYSWGDAKDIRSRFCPAFKTYENEVKKISVNKKETILWCGGGFGITPRYMNFTSPAYRNDASRQSEIANIENFIGSMNQKLLKKLVIRPRDPGGYGIIELFQELIPDVKIDLMIKNAYAVSDGVRTSLYERFNESRVVICETLYTSVFYEALYSNIPVIVIEQDIHSEIKDYLYDDVISYFYELKKVGIWYENGCEAAVFLNNNYETLESWWMEPERQKVRKNVLDRFFMSTDHLAEWWEREFIELLNQRKRQNL